jgi:hypothetical protein
LSRHGHCVNTAADGKEYSQKFDDQFRHGHHRVLPEVGVASCNIRVHPISGSPLSVCPHSLAHAWVRFDILAKPFPLQKLVDSVRTSRAFKISEVAKRMTRRSPDLARPSTAELPVFVDDHP